MTTILDLRLEYRTIFLFCDHYLRIRLAWAGGCTMLEINTALIICWRIQTAPGAVVRGVRGEYWIIGYKFLFSRQHIMHHCEFIPEKISKAHERMFQLFTHERSGK